MTRVRPLAVAVVSMGLALLLMQVALAWPTPATLGLFLGAGLPLGAIGIVAFSVRVLRDLRDRKVL
jgi:hypothetical protein